MEPSTTETPTMELAKPGSLSPHGAPLPWSPPHHGAPHHKAPHHRAPHHRAPQAAHETKMLVSALKINNFY